MRPRSNIYYIPLEDLNYADIEDITYLLRFKFLEKKGKGGYIYAPQYDSIYFKLHYFIENLIQLTREEYLLMRTTGELPNSRAETSRI